MTKAEIAYEYRTASAKIHINKCHLVGIIVTPDGTNDSYVDIYDGNNTSAPQVARIRVVSTTTVPIIFPDHILMRHGIYVAFETNLSSVTVLWHPLPD